MAESRSTPDVVTEANKEANKGKEEARKKALTEQEWFRKMAAVNYRHTRKSLGLPSKNFLDLGVSDTVDLHEDPRARTETSLTGDRDLKLFENDHIYGDLAGKAAAKYKDGTITSVREITRFNLNSTFTMTIN